MAEAQGSLPEDIRRGLRAAAMGGVAKLKSFIMDSNSAWKNIPINIAITGQSGEGKSSFINTLRGLTADDEGAAHVDVVEATTKIESYTHPRNKNMIFWDLPGVGTPNFPQHTYLEKVNFGRFDFFLIMSAGRFQENDLWLAIEIRKLNKNFQFVRTKIDIDITSDKQSHPKTHERSHVLKRIKEDCVKNLADHCITETSIFLIDSYTPLEYDFDVFATTLIDEAPEHKKEAMTLSMSLLTTGVLQKKFEVLNKRIISASIFSAIGGALPKPLLGLAVDGMILLEEVDFFKQQFGLDAETLEDYALLLKTESRELEKRLSLKCLSIAGTAKVGTTSFVRYHWYGLRERHANWNSFPNLCCFFRSLIWSNKSFFGLLPSVVLRGCKEDQQNTNTECIELV